MIKELSLEYAWLSSFYADAPFSYNGRIFRSIVQAYEYCKCANEQDREKLLTLGSYDAHKFGQTVVRVPDWSVTKYTVLLDILYTRFSEEPLKGKLLWTNGQVLVASAFNDKFGDWSFNWEAKYEDCASANYYGKLLMITRHYLTNNMQPGNMSLPLLDVSGRNIMAKCDLRELQGVCYVYNRR